MAEAAAVVIRSGSLGEGPRLKQIAIAAKGFWGYDPDRFWRGPKEATSPRSASAS